MCGGTTNTTNTTTQQSMSPQMQQSYQDLMSSAKNQAATPYQTYDGPRVAPLDQQQQQAADTAQAMQGNYEGDLNSARTYTGLGATNVAGNFYNPQTYNTQAVNPSTVTPGTAGLYQAGLAQGTAPANVQAQQIGNIPQVQAQQIAAQQVAAERVQAQQVQNLPQVNAQQIDPSRLPQVQAQNTSTGQFGQNQFSQYGNPYQQAVINATMGQLGYQQQQNLNQADSRATQSGAFGGDRSGIEQAQIYRDNSQVQAQALAGLNTANWAQAQQQFNADQGRGLQSQIANQGANLQAGLANQGQNLSALQSNQGTNLQGQLANQGTNLAAQQTNVGANLQGQLANQGTNLQGQLANQGSSLQASLANQSTGLQGQEFNANTNFQGQLANQGANLQAGLANQGWQGNYGLANMAAANQQMQFNAGQGNQMGQFNTGLNFQGQLANQSAGLQGQMFNSTQAMQAQQLNDQSKQYYANLAQNDRNRQLAAGSQYMGITGQEQQAKLNDIGALMQTGAMSQQQQQQNYNTAYNDFVQQRQYPFQTIGWQSDIYHGIPAPMSSSGSTQTPGPNLASSALGAVGTGIGAYMAYGMHADGGMVGPGGFQSGDGSGMASGYAPGGQVQTDMYGRPVNTQSLPQIPGQVAPQTGFWDAGPSGVSPAMSIFGAIGRQQGPNFMSNVAAGAGEGMQDIGKQRLLGAQISDAQSQAAQRNMIAQQSLARMGALKSVSQFLSGGAPAGASASPNLPGGPSPASGVPGGSGQAGAGPVPGSPAPGVPTSPGAPPTPPGPVSPQPIPSQQPAGQPMGSGAMGVPTAPGQQVAAPAAPGGPGPVDQQRPGLSAETIMQSPSLATAPSTTAAQQAAPQQGGSTGSPTLDYAVGFMNWAKADPQGALLLQPEMKEQIGVLQNAATTHRAIDASGNEFLLPHAAQNAANMAFAESQGKAEGELPTKMRFMQAEQGAIGSREKGVIAFKSPYDIKLAGATAAFHGAQERQTQTHGAGLEMVNEPVPEIGQDGKPTGKFVEQHMTRLQATQLAGQGGPAQMAGFGGSPGGGAPAGAPEPPPQVSGATSAASGAPALPEASSAPPAAPQQAPAAKVYPGFTGQPVQTPQQRATGEDLGKHTVAQYEGDVTHLTENQDQLQKANMAIQALTQLQTGKWANFQNDIGQHLQAIGIDPTKFDLNNPADYQVLESQAIEGTFKMVHALTSRAALQEVKMGREATYDPAKAPGANVKFLADILSGLNWENKLYGDRIQNFQATQGAQQFDINSWIKNNPLPAEYQRALADMPKFKGEEEGSRGPNIPTPGTAKQAPPKIPTAQDIQGLPPAQIPAYKSNLAKMDVQKMSPQERAQWLEAVHALKGIGQ